ncbi:hypothetical protein I4U23_014372 [Adineta vaga]|nr:hypothetical protein I4U23_014372 [Adineta vaga]
MDYFQQPNEFSDVKISFKNENNMVLYANKVILSEASPIIKAFLAIEPDNTFVIDEDDEQCIITSNDVIELLKFIYPQFTIKITDQNINGLIHLSEKYLIETLRNECKKYVYTWLNDMELTTVDEKKEFLPRHVLYKDGTRKHIASEIGKNSRKKIVMRVNCILHKRAFNLVQSDLFIGLDIRVSTLCIWLHEYSSRDETLSSSILNILKHASTDDLERNEIFSQMTDREKTNIYKIISEYLEHQTIHEKDSSGVIHHKQSTSLMFASGDN